MCVPLCCTCWTASTTARLSSATTSTCCSRRTSSPDSSWVRPRARSAGRPARPGPGSPARSRARASRSTTTVTTAGCASPTCAPPGRVAAETATSTPWSPAACRQHRVRRSLGQPRGGGTTYRHQAVRPPRRRRHPGRLRGARDVRRRPTPGHPQRPRRHRRRRPAATHQSPRRRPHGVGGSTPLTRTTSDIGCYRDEWAPASRSSMRVGPVGVQPRSSRVVVLDAERSMVKKVPIHPK